MPLRSPVTKLNEAISQQRRSDRTHFPTRVVQRNADGTVDFQRLDGECIERSPQCAVYAGQIVERPCRQFNLQGAAGLPMASTGLRRDTLTVERLEPDTFARGWSGTVIVTGRGFTALTVIEFLLADLRTLNPSITVSEIRYVDAETLEVDLAVAVDADLTRIPLRDPVTGELTGEVVDVPLPIAYDNPGSPV